MPDTLRPVQDARVPAATSTMITVSGPRLGERRYGCSVKATWRPSGERRVRLGGPVVHVFDVVLSREALLESLAQPAE